MKIQTILDSIDLGAIALPEFQRGYIWNRDQWTIGEGIKLINFSNAEGYRVQTRSYHTALRRKRPSTVDCATDHYKKYK